MECKKRGLSSTRNKAHLVSTSGKTTEEKHLSKNVPKKTTDDHSIKKNFIKINKLMTRNNDKKKETEKKVNADKNTKVDRKETVDKIEKVILKCP